MRKLASRFKHKFRRDGDADPTNYLPASEPTTASTTQATNAPTQLADSPVDQAANSGNAPPTQELATGFSERLWTKAYDGLREEESDLIKSYEKILSKVQAEWKEDVTPTKVDTLQHCKNNESRQMWMMVYTGLERSKRQANYKETASNFIEAINNIKGLIDTVVKYSAEAGVVWAGVSLGLEILSNPMKEPGLNRKAIAYVLSKMEWYWNLTDAVLGQEKALSPSTPSHALRNNLEDHVVDFYKKLLVFQMQSACLYYRNWASIILRDMVKLDDWNGKLNELKDSEATIRRDIKQFNTENVKFKLDGIENNSTIQAEFLENIYSVIREQARLREKKEQDDEDKNCLRALHVTDPQLDKQRIQMQKRGPLTQSCDWVFASTAYEQFISDNSKRVLWISGLPGKGKTMLACGIIDKLKESLRPLAFFFCEASAVEASLSDETGAIRGLIYMLLDYQPSLVSILRPYYEKIGETLFNNINSGIILVEILTKILQNPCFHEALIVIDALDECNGRSSLIDVINGLSGSCPTKWILTSRPWPEIKTELSAAQGLMSLNLEDEKESVSKAVKSYITTTVDILARKWGDDAELKATISEYMYSHADNTFLWVALVCQRLSSSSIPKRRVLDELKAFPATLDDLYRAMMERIIKSGEEDLLTRILATVCIAYRRLTPAELATLMGDIEEDEVADAIAWCGSFLDYQNGKIFLVHQSARDFLFEKVPEKIFPNGTEFRHHAMFLRSLEALSATLKRDIYGLDTPGPIVDISIPDPDPLAPIRYSCVYWIDHLKSSKPKSGTSGHALEDNGAIHQFFETKYLNWIEALSLSYRVPNGIIAVQNLEALAGHMNATRLGKLLQDARRFLLSCKPAIEVAPLQVYASALVFSPTRSLIKQLYQRETPVRVIPPLAVGSDWNACLLTMEHIAYGSGVGVCSVCFSDDGQWLASGSYDVKIWSASTGECLQVLEGHEGLIQAVKISPNNLMLASGSGDSTVRIWDPMTGTRTNVLRGHKSSVVSLSFSPDSSKVASGSTDGTIKVWHAIIGTCLQTIDDSRGPITSIAFLSGNERLVSVRKNSGINVWDLSTGRLESTVECDRDLAMAAFAADLSKVLTVTLHNSPKIWDTFSGQCLSTIRNSDLVCSVAWAPDGTRLALGTYHRHIEVWNPHSGQLLQTLEGHSNDIRSLAFTLKGTQLLSGSRDGTLKIWNLVDSQNLTTESKEKGPPTVVKRIHVLSDAIFLSTEISTSDVRVWDRSTGACLRVLQDYADSGHVLTLPLSSDGKRMVLISDDGFFSIQDVSTGTEMQRFKGEHGNITCAVFSSDDAFLASGSDEGVIKIWNSVTGACLHTFVDGHNSRVKRLAISPDNTKVVSVFGNDSVSIWDVAKSLCRCTIQGPLFGGYPSVSDMYGSGMSGGQIVSMLFSCDSEWLAFGSSLGLIYIINGQDSSDRQTLTLHDGAVHVLAFSPDNTMLASATRKGIVKVCNIFTHTYLYTIKGYTTHLSWDPKYESRLQTDFGDFDVPRSPTDGHNQEPATYLDSVGLGISPNHEWITRQGKPILWLPVEYRPYVYAVQGNDVIVSAMSALFYWLRFPVG